MNTLPLEDAIESLLNLYRDRLLGDHELVVKDWQEFMEQNAHVEEDGEEFVLVIAD